MTTTADRLRKAREDAGFATAADFARTVGVKPVTYRTHESGYTKLKADTAQLYADKLGVTAAWLLYGEGEAPRPGGNLEALEDDLRQKVEAEPPGPRRDAWLKVIAEIEETKASGQAYGRMDLESAATVRRTCTSSASGGRSRPGPGRRPSSGPRRTGIPSPPCPCPPTPTCPSSPSRSGGPP